MNQIHDPFDYRYFHSPRVADRVEVAFARVPLKPSKAVSNAALPSPPIVQGGRCSFEIGASLDASWMRRKEAVRWI